VELKGERTLPVGRDLAWAALNDVDALKSAVPGCESIVPAGDSAFDVVVNAAIGPVKARFKGKLQLADVNAPESYTIRFDMQGGQAGCAQSTLMPATFTTFAHFSMSPRRNSPNLSGDMLTVSAPCFLQASLMSARAITLPISALSRSITVLGVPAGAMTPSQITAS